MPATYALGRGFTVERTFDAPPADVFRAWTDPDQLGWFFNPDNPVEEPATVDLRVGGQWRQQMVIDAKTRYVTGGMFREISPPGRLAFYHGAVGGWPALDPGRPEDCPLCTMTLTPLPGGRTAMDFRVQLPDHLSEAQTAEWLAVGMPAGWGMTIDRLVDALRARANV